MVAPLISPVLASIGGIISSALSFFVANKLPRILASIGFTFVAYKGVDKVLNTVIDKVQSVGISGIVNFYGNSIDVLGFAASCGVFDAISIVFSGYSSLAVLIMSNKFFKYVGVSDS